MQYYVLCIVAAVGVIVTSVKCDHLDDDEGYSYHRPPGSITYPASEPVVHKHIYVHVPPPDPEFHAPPHRIIPPPPPKKHYKIVFIKAPTYSPPTVPPLPEIQQHEEKTLIYVLHKNPQEAPPIVIPTAKPTQPSKPEVYFIRYKTQKEVGYAPSPTPNHHHHGETGLGFLGSTTAVPHFVHSTPVYSASTIRPHRQAAAVSPTQSSPRPSSISILPRKYASPPRPTQLTAT